MDSGWSVRGVRRAGRARCLLPIVAILLAPGTGAAQLAGFGVRAGVVLSTPLAEDRVANPRLAAALGEVIGPVRAVPAPGLQLEVTGAMAMRARTMLDLAIGWTFAGIDAKDAEGSRGLQDVGVGQATVSVRYLATPRIDGGCGVGLIRYFAEARMLFASGTDLSPLLECGARVGVAGRAGRRLSLRVAGQAHRFRTPVLVDAGARTGTVFRLAIQAGIDLGRAGR